jgi:hypothetical protein
VPGQGQGVQIQVLRFGPMTQQVQVILESISGIFWCVINWVTDGAVWGVGWDRQVECCLPMDPIMNSS